MNINKKISALMLTSFIVILDQITKFFIKESLTLGEPINLLGKYVRLNFITNPGMAFGIRVGGRMFFIVFTFIATLVILILLFKAKDGHSWTRIGLASILGGAIGNLIDRVMAGEVVDFIEIGPWPIFNIADIAVTFGMVVLIIIVFFEKKKISESQEEKFEIG